MRKVLSYFRLKLSVVASRLPDFPIGIHSMADSDQLLEQFEELFEAERIHKRGFASMSQAKRRAIAGRGGIAAHAKGKAHTWTREEARRAGRKGGLKRKSSGIPDLNAGK